MTLDQVFIRAGITHAHIVDDAYDQAPADRNSDAEIQQFVDSLADPDFDALADLLEVDRAEDAIKHALTDLVNVRRLFRARRRFASASDILFATFLRERKDRQAKIKPLIKRLTDCGVHCHAYGPDARGVGKHSPQLIFIDLQLRNRNGVTIDDALAEYERIVAK